MSDKIYAYQNRVAFGRIDRKGGYSTEMDAQTWDYISANIVWIFRQVMIQWRIISLLTTSVPRVAVLE